MNCVFKPALSSTTCIAVVTRPSEIIAREKDLYVRAQLFKMYQPVQVMENPL